MPDDWALQLHIYPPRRNDAAYRTVGSAMSPLLANLLMHYAFDAWDKPFQIAKAVVWQAFQRVQANKGAAGGR